MENDVDDKSNEILIKENNNRHNNVKNEDTTAIAFKPQSFLIENNIVSNRRPTEKKNLLTDSGIII